ncbi:hypothetical protein Vadar_009743 [Vaccinium darrowii]|uniref:Uncharacterized protein n=1 Tax=Vaccinium darrowii TaxID=229202 RepID=A0ACB7ZJI2_9ERIC|nr:hypothetical protein Vadar_009743 [Vaccinium darrowii]
MEVMTPSPPVDFKFDSTSTSPFLTPPSSPPHHHFTPFFSAPTSPSSSFRHRLDTCSSAAIPFSWEEKPGTPKSKQHPIETETDFEFDFFSGQLDRTSLSNLSAADELFDGGVIKPLKPPPRLQFSENNNFDSPKSPKSPSKTKFLKEALSPRHHHKKKDFDPFEAAIEQTRRENYSDHQQKNNNKFERGRERTYDSSNSSSRRQKGTRSLSPFRVCDIFAENYQESSSSSASSSTKNSGWRGYKKWKLKDLLLFRSASEGRATTTGKDPLKKYSLKQSVTGITEDVKNSSFRSTESSGSVSRRRGSGGQVSAHELHYTTNRAVSEEMRRKTFLPYNHGLLGCLGFNPAVHDISRGIGSMTRG